MNMKSSLIKHQDPTKGDSSKKAVSKTGSTVKKAAAARAKTTKRTVNFTSSVEKDLLQRAKVIAAKMDTSINALFNSHLQYLIETFEASEQNSNDNYHILLEFSLGKINFTEVVNKLAIDSEEDLFLLMAKSHLPMPRLPDVETRKMVDELQKLNTLHQKDH